MRSSGTAGADGQGRRLVITGDHGYADASSFSERREDENTVKLLRSFFGASRCTKEDSASRMPATEEASGVYLVWMWM